MPFTVEQCCDNLGVSKMCLGSCMGDNPGKNIGGFTPLQDSLCSFYDKIINHCWEKYNSKNEGE